MPDALLTIAHGTVESLDDLPAFLTVIRRGHPPSPELAQEVRRRYETIGGRSPLNDICRELTAKLGHRLGMRAAFCARLWHPKPDEALAMLLDAGVTRVVVLPLAQHSAPIYVDAVRKAMESRAAKGEPVAAVVGPGNWGLEPALIRTYARELTAAIDALSVETRSVARVVVSAHSLPVAVIRGGDPYEKDFRASADAVAKAVGSSMLPYDVVFQSQGMGGGEWLGPDVRGALERLAREGVKHVVFAPIGFLADHVEVLYDLDVEARGWAEALGMTTSRTRSLNASDGLVDALEAVARRLVG